MWIEAVISSVGR